MDYNKQIEELNKQLNCLDKELNTIYDKQSEIRDKIDRLESKKFKETCSEFFDNASDRYYYKDSDMPYHYTKAVIKIVGKTFTNNIKTVLYQLSYNDGEIVYAERKGVLYLDDLMEFKSENYLTEHQMVDFKYMCDLSVYDQVDHVDFKKLTNSCGGTCKKL